MGGSALLLAFAARGDEHARIARDDLVGVANGLKAFSGHLSGLLDPELMAAKERREGELRRRITGDPELAAEYGDPWAEIEVAIERQRAVYPRSRALTGLSVPRLAVIAHHIVRLAAELEKPGPERLREYRDTALPSLYQRFYSEAPVYSEYQSSSSPAHSSASASSTARCTRW